MKQAEAGQRAVKLARIHQIEHKKQEVEALMELARRAVNRGDTDGHPRTAKVPDGEVVRRRTVGWPREGGAGGEIDPVVRAWKGAPGPKPSPIVFGIE